MASASQPARVFANVQTNRAHDKGQLLRSVAAYVDRRTPLDFACAAIILTLSSLRLVAEATCCTSRGTTWTPSWSTRS